MTVRVRFAPSPTGYLHIGGLRTAIYNYLFAKANNGTFILRIEDTDKERSSREFETLQMQDMKWAGITWDEGPDKPGEVGPYRQSERFDLYKKYAEKLLESGHAYYCFATDEELESMKEKAFAENRAPYTDNPYRELSLEEARKKVASGEKAVIRFRTENTVTEFDDLVRGHVKFPETMVGDFVILRSDGSPVYNFCCVVDDITMKITHVIRGEDHLSNTVRQLMVYKALGAKLPEFAHVSLLIGEDRQKLSKRHGATSVNLYREQSYLPQALCNYLCLLGWSHPDEKDIFTLDEIVSLFDTKRFSKAAAIYDIEKLNYINGQHLKNESEDDLLGNCLRVIPSDHIFQKQSEQWQKQAIHFYKDHLHFYQDILPLVDELFETSINREGEVEEVLSWETTPQIVSYLSTQVTNKEGYPTEDEFAAWTDHCKKELKIKGKQLFKGMRVALTGQGQGKDLKHIIPLTPYSVIQERLSQLG